MSIEKVNENNANIEWLSVSPRQFHPNTHTHSLKLNTIPVSVSPVRDAWTSNHFHLGWQSDSGVWLTTAHVEWKLCEHRFSGILAVGELVSIAFRPNFIIGSVSHFFNIISSFQEKCVVNGWVCVCLPLRTSTTLSIPFPCCMRIKIIAHIKIIKMSIILLSEKVITKTSKYKRNGVYRSGSAIAHQAAWQQQICSFGPIDAEKGMNWNAYVRALNSTHSRRHRRAM